MLAGKSRGGTPFCRMWKTVFPMSKDFCKVIFRCNCSAGTVTRLLFTAFGKQGGAVLFAPPRKAVAFLTTRSVCQKHGTGISLPAGSDQGYSPWTSPTFLKNCWIKKLFSCLRLEFCNLFSMHKKTSLLWEAFLLWFCMHIYSWFFWYVNFCFNLCNPILFNQQNGKSNRIISYHWRFLCIRNPSQ